MTNELRLRLVHALAERAAAVSSPPMTCEQMAELLQVTTRTLRRVELMGEIPLCIHVGGLERWRRDEVAQLSPTVVDGRAVTRQTLPL